MLPILCIDDIPQVLVSRKALLETRGYEVLTAHDGPYYDLPGMMGDEVALNS